MLALNHIASAVTEELEVQFPNLFDGLTITYFRGFELFGIPIYWYGVLIAVGVVLAYIYAHMRRKQFGIDGDRMFDVVFVALIGGFFGARLYYCIFAGGYDFITFFTDIRNGGLAIYGGLIGALLVGVVMCKLRKVKILAMFDIASIGFLIGQCMGRLGNFVNQECYGAATEPDYFLGMTGTIISSEVEAETLVHPCFLYESLWCLLGFALLHFYSKKLRSYDGEIFLLYCVWYGLGRFFIEGLRTDSLYIGETGIRVSQLVAAIAFFVGLVLFIAFKVITEKKQIPLWVNSEAWAAQQEEFKKLAEAKAAKKAAKEGEAKSILSEDADEVTLDDGESHEDEEDNGDSIDEDEEDSDNGNEDDEIQAEDSSDDINDNESEE
ncbi:MAG: prolipoprotein diacylglyceryl transferase [Oscillospiraceae bacterium]|nr:prolipoprotein diacylglyceryl transferase [Oscillospiraceae bacterium]